MFGLRISKLKSPVILDMPFMFASFVRPIEFSISISASLEELRLRQNVFIKSFFGPRIFPPKGFLWFAVRDRFYVSRTAHS